MFALAACAYGVVPDDAAQRPDIVYGNDGLDFDPDRPAGEDSSFGFDPDASFDFDVIEVPEDSGTVEPPTDAGGCATDPSRACTPGDRRAGGCDPCAEQVCTASCAWSACRLKSGNACEYRGGVNSRSCSTCQCGRQWCLSSCRWSTSCVSCCTSCGGCL